LGGRKKRGIKDISKGKEGDTPRNLLTNAKWMSTTNRMSSSKYPFLSQRSRASEAMPLVTREFLFHSNCELPLSSHDLSSMRESRPQTVSYDAFLFSLLFGRLLFPDYTVDHLAECDNSSYSFKGWIFRLCVEPSIELLFGNYKHR